ncbi:MAG: hypothetical protein HYW86_00070 [Candidatus Roizmanbacteria bacterium]|nr:MAG: hypothetical protein HYW86_00070 [Candidatus Roizmanbacteria bacterium]
MEKSLPEPERSKFKELPFTADLFLKDNQSPEAQNNIRRALEAKSLHARIVVDVCSDARSAAEPLFDTMGPQVASLNSVAGSAPIERTAYVLNHEGVGQIFVLSHFDSQALTPDESPEGCGGRTVKKHLSHGSVSEEERDLPIMKYVDSNVISSDVFLQPWERAKLIAKYAPDKHILVGTVDHRTGLIIPMGYVWAGGKGAYTSVPLHDIRDTKLMYPDGYPQSLKLEEIPEIFRPALIDNQNKVKRKLKEDPTFREKMGTQRPCFVVVRDSIIGARLRYPNLMGGMNKAFSIFAPYHKERNINGGVYITRTQEDLETVLSQLQYPIIEGLKAKPGEAFDQTSVVVFESNLFYLAKELADAAMDEEWFKAWYRQKKDGKPRDIFVGVVRSGRTTAMYNYEELLKQ